MAYIHIDNLYKNQEILMFKECYVMEKIHGTSAHISFEALKLTQIDNKIVKNLSEVIINYFSGGIKYEEFIQLFNKEDLIDRFKELNLPPMIIYGEAYGGKCQGMKEIYGDKLRFVAFEVKIGHSWLSVSDAESIVKQLGLDFVWYIKTSTDINILNKIRQYPSKQARQNGITEPKKMEGIVLRPLIELQKSNGERIIAKHKNDEFRETKTKRDITDSIKLKTLADAKAVAEEWVTPMRLAHILGKINKPDITMMRTIISTMIEDIKREGEKEIIWSKEVERSIGKRTASLVKEYFKDKLKG